MVVQCAYIAVDRLVVVIEDDEQVGGAAAGVVEAFEGKASGERSVADERDGLLIAPAHLGRFGQAEGSRDGCRRVPDAESVVGALFHLGKSAYAVAGAVLLEKLLAAGQDLVGVGLVADVEDDLVRGRIIYIVETYYQLNGAQAGSQVPGIAGTAVHHV